MQDAQLYTIIALCIYAIAMALIGCISYGKSKTLDGFLIGGRNIGAWVTAFAYGTTYFSAVVFVGYAGQHGWNIGIGSIWIGIGNAVLGCLLSWLLFANRTRKMTKKLNARTMPDYFEKRYDSKGMKIFSAAIIFIFLVPYSAAVYKGLGSLFSAVFPGVETWVWMLIIACLTAVYLVAGGYVATAYTDLVQGIIMIVGVICLVVTVLGHDSVGGISGLIENLRNFQSLPDDPNPTTGAQLTNIFGGSSFKFLCFNIMLTSFGTWGLPQMIGKFYAIKDTAAIKRGTIISTLFCVIIGCGAYLIGSTSRLILGGVLPEGGIDAVIPAVLMEVLSGGTLGIILLAIIMILLLSASMSTLEAVVLTSASAVAVDLIPAVRKKETKPETQMLLTRLLCLAFVACSFIFATQNIPIIVSLMSFSWGVVSGCFIGPYIWGLFSKKITKIGAYAGILSGLLTVGITTLVITLNSGFSSAAAKSPEMGVAAMAVSFVVVPLVSLVTKKPDAKKVDEIFECYNEAE
ncbi:MAG: sodium:solute symporter family protein [Clostridia bacterium]|nr:sodium:solute symporter family protein [Clostridia bacterium]MBQ7897842.1 sodium:solute symporter family protein [Clostridia bacterium]